MQRNIVAVDGDPDTRDLIVTYLERHDFHVSTAADGREMRRKLSERLVDLVILDIVLPGEDGLALIRYLRARSDIPIVIVSALDDAADRILALEMGADDYVTKPFVPRELTARIKTFLRRAQASGSGPRTVEKAQLYRFAGWEFDRQFKTLTRMGGQPTRLTHGESQLLLAFLNSSQRVLSREQLLAATRGPDAEIFERAVDMQVLRLRRKLGVDSTAPPLIRTERNEGYVFTATVEVMS